VNEVLVPVFNAGPSVMVEKYAPCIREFTGKLKIIIIMATEGMFV
jgi:hypothetical protein